jgi:hypothetical protein
MWEVQPGNRYQGMTVKLPSFAEPNVIVTLQMSVTWPLGNHKMPQLSRAVGPKRPFVGKPRS